ncbi:hypothetical protein APHAL10511_005119 [Amanita phalloides]|nr:hypothetical protein APHAL10511_005119 [Amanita phalloides]
MGHHHNCRFNGQRKLLIAFDIGTTFSYVSYSILDPGLHPEIKGVQRFPAQVHGNSKIPSVLWYDANGKARAIGAEAVQDGMEEIAEESGWTKASWFKLHLRPKTDGPAFISDMIPPLPKGVTVVEIFADMLRYLHCCTKEYIEQTHATGEMLWKSLQHQTHFVLTLPNRWADFQQQSQMKQAAINAGLISDMEATNISFVTEGEATLSYSALSDGAFKGGKCVILVDAGDFTVDVTAYAQTSVINNTYEEIATPECHTKGSAFITLEAERFLEDHLCGSQYSTLEDRKRMIKVFDKRIKLSFRRVEDPQFIKFGGLKDNDPSKGIRSGQLKLAGTDVARLFAPTLQCILESVWSARNHSKKSISLSFCLHCITMGDANNSTTNRALRHFGIDVLRPGRHLTDVVVNGAVVVYLNRYTNMGNEEPRSSRKGKEKE